MNQAEFRPEIHQFKPMPAATVAGPTERSTMTKTKITKKRKIAKAPAVAARWSASHQAPVMPEAPKQSTVAEAPEQTPAEIAADKRMWKLMRAAMNSDRAIAYAAKMQAQLDEHKKMLRMALVMKQTWSNAGTWTLIDAVWEFRDERRLTDLNNRSAAIHMNQLRINLKVNWTNELVLTKAQQPVLKAAFAGDFQVWSCLRHDHNGATAIVLWHPTENKYMIVYEDGSFTKTFGAPRLRVEVWPTVAKITRNTAAARAAANLEVTESGAIVMKRK